MARTILAGSPGGRYAAPSIPLDRADQVGVDLVDDLFVGEFLGRTEETVARVVNDHVDAAKLGKGPTDDAVDGGSVGQIKRGEPELVAVLLFQVVDGFQLAGGSGHPVAAVEQLLGHVAAEAAADTGDEPSAL